MMPEKLDSSIVLLRERIEQGMRGSADLILDEFELAGVKGLAFMFDGLVSNTQVSDFLLRPINRMAPPEADPEKLWEYLRSQFLFSSEQGIVETYEDLFTKAMSGFAMVMLDGVPRALSLGYQGFETRGVGEPAMEKNLRGSREGFTESNNTNTAMVRRRLKSPNLTVETLYLGRQSRTNVRLCYLSDVAAPETVEAVRQELREASLPLVLDSGFLQAFIGKGAASLFSGTGTTQRPDTLCAKLAEGRVGVMVDGSPNVMIAPYLFTEHFHTLDDYTQRPYFTAFVRLLRLAAFFLTVLLPGYYVAVVTFHPERIPRMLLPAFLGSVSATPLSAMGEALALFLLYELLREAGLRLPDAIGHTLSVVGRHRHRGCHCDRRTGGPAHDHHYRADRRKRLRGAQPVRAGDDPAVFIHLHRRDIGALRHGAGLFGAGGQPVQPAYFGHTAHGAHRAVAAPHPAGSILAQRLAAAGAGGLQCVLRPPAGKGADR